MKTVMQRDFPASTILSMLEVDELLPGIIFRSSRAQCDLDVEKIVDRRKLWLSGERQKELKKAVSEVLVKYDISEKLITRHPQYKSLIYTGVGAHHAGQLLIWRLLLEELMSKGLMRLLIATGTVAAGVDFPARSVVITAHSRRDSEGFKVLSASELQQMSGRAGRRGKDAVGFCLVAPGAFCDARVINEVSKKPPEILRSSYFASPSTVLNLLKYRNVDELRYTVEKSLGSFHDQKSAGIIRGEARVLKERLDKDGQLKSEKVSRTEKRIRRKEKEAEKLEQRQGALLELSLEGLEELGYVKGGVLTPKGIWSAELCTSLVLELGEAIDSFLLSDLQIEELVGVVASIAGDSYRSYLRIRKNPVNPELFDQMEDIVERVKGTYQGSPFASEVVLQPDAAVTVLTWLESEDWAEFSSLLRLGGVAEGDAARLISQTADHLQQITRLSESHPDLASQAVEARGLLLRPPVSDAYQSLVNSG